MCPSNILQDLVHDTNTIVYIHSRQEWFRERDQNFRRISEILTDMVFTDILLAQCC